MTAFLERLRVALLGPRVVRKRTMFGVARVYQTHWQGDLLRVLDVGRTFQSATYLDERWCDPPFPYLARYDTVFDAPQPMRRLCMLGGGGFAYPKHVIAHHDPASIDVIEIDPTIIDLAERYFFLDRLRTEYRTYATGRLHTICSDALAYLRTCAQTGVRYDAILNDCFVARNPAHDLSTQEAAELAHACLEPGGLYLSNVVAALEGPDAYALMDVIATLSMHFDHVLAIPSDRVAADELDNVMLIATDSAWQPPDAIRLFDAV